MTLEQFAKAAGVTIVDCGTGWGGRIGYKTKDHPNCTEAGYRTNQSAYRGWAENTFGTNAAKALFKLLKHQGATKLIDLDSSTGFTFFDREKGSSFIGEVEMLKWLVENRSKDYWEHKAKTGEAK